MPLRKRLPYINNTAVKCWYVIIIKPYQGFCPVLPWQAHDGEFANLIVWPRICVDSVIKQLEGNMWSMLVRGACNWKMWRESVWECSFHGLGDITVWNSYWSSASLGVGSNPTLYHCPKGGSTSSVTKQSLNESALTSVVTVCCHQLIQLKQK